jgi:hypothetical protein
MYNFRGLPYLKSDNWVKVKGRPASDGTFAALEVTVKTGREFIEIEGLIQNIDLAHSKLHIANTCISLPSGIPVRNVSAEEVAITTLQKEDLIWIEGKYSDNGRFMPQSIDKRQKQDFNLDILQGSVEWVDQRAKSFGLVGLTVLMSARTSVEVEWDVHTQ